MDDRKLADAVVALGVGQVETSMTEPWYVLPEYDDDAHFLVSPYSFVRDWRVAGALMKKWQPMVIERQGTTGPFIVQTKRNIEIRNDSLPRAIIEACVQALQESES